MQRLQPFVDRQNRGKRKSVKSHCLFPKSTKKVVPKKVGQFNVLRFKPNGGGPKSIQVAAEFSDYLKKNPSVLREFYKCYRTVRLTGEVKTSKLSVRVFDPKDASSQHDLLLEVSLKGKKYFVKVAQPVQPNDSVTQFVTHILIQFARDKLAGLKVVPLEYVMAVNTKKNSFLVAEWVKGIQLENWLRADKRHLQSEVYGRFLKAERMLRQQYHVKDLTTRNTIYNPKTDILTLVDLKSPHLMRAIN